MSSSSSSSSAAIASAKFLHPDEGETSILIDTGNATSTPDGKKIHVIISCCDVAQQYADISVLCWVSQLNECMETMFKKPTHEVVHLFKSTYASLTIHSRDKVIDMWRGKNDNWNDWCGDVLLFYTCRYVLLKKPIPLRKYDSLSDTSKQNVLEEVRVLQRK